MTLKAGIRLDNISPQIVLAMIVADQCYGGALVITSVNDSKHMEGSKHYSGSAFDCRTTSAGINQTQAQKIVTAMKERLGADFDVVLEDDHIHCEYDPTRPVEPGRA